MRHEVVTPTDSFTIFAFRHHVRVDLTADFFGNTSEQLRQPSQSQIANDHEVDVTVGKGFAFSHRTEHESESQVCSRKRLLKHFNQAGGLLNETVNLDVEGVVFIGSIVDAVAITSSLDQIELAQLPELLPDRGLIELRPASDLTNMEFHFVNAKEKPKDRGTHARREDSSQDIHTRVYTTQLRGISTHFWAGSARARHLTLCASKVKNATRMTQNVKTKDVIGGIAFPADKYGTTIYEAT